MCSLAVGPYCQRTLFLPVATGMHSYAVGNCVSSPVAPVTPYQAKVPNGRRVHIESVDPVRHYCANGRSEWDEIYATPPLLSEELGYGWKGG